MVSMDEIKAWQRAVGADPDGKPGPKTYAATVTWLRDRGHIAPQATTEVGRARVVQIARSQLGQGDPDVYYRDAAPQFLGSRSTHWCGVFALWCLRRAALTDRTWVTGKGFAYGYLPIVSLPEPGDIAYYERNQHYAVVERVNGDGTVTTIDGNSTGGRVARNTRRLQDAALYFSIGKLG